MKQDNNSDASRMNSETISGVVYTLLNPASFRKLLTRFEDVKVVKVVDGAEETKYSIVGEEFITECLDLDIIKECEDGPDVVCTLRSPEQLITMIERVEREQYGDTCRYRVVTNRGTINVSGEDIFSLNSYKPQLLTNCKILLSFSLKEKGKKEGFDELLMYIVNIAEDIWVSDESEEEREGDAIIAELRNLQIVEERDDFRSEYTTLSEDGVYKIRSKTLKAVAKGVGIDEGYVKLEQILRPYLASKSSQVRVDKKKVSVWNFVVGGWD